MLAPLARGSGRSPSLRALYQVTSLREGRSWSRTSQRRQIAATRSLRTALQDVLKAVEDVGDGTEVEAEVDDRPSEVHAGGQQGVLWFANIYPTKAFRLDIRQMFTHHNHDTLVPRLLPEGVEVLKTVPREREGGAFVYFRAPPAFVLKVLRNLPPSEKEAAAQPHQRFVKKEDLLSTVCKGISNYLKMHSIRAFLSPDPVRAHRVLGTPYIEDLQARYPTSRLRVRVEPSSDAVTEEWIYKKVRRYGTLDDIHVLPEGKGFSVSFRHIAGAVAARNCLHRASLALNDGSNVLLRIDFEPFMTKWLREFIRNNARYLIPLVVAFTFGTTYFIWDPLRTISVELKIASAMKRDPGPGMNGEVHEFHGLWGMVLRAWVNWSQVETRLLAMWRHDSTGGGLLRDFWEDRDAEVTELKEWLTQPQDQIMLLTGHRGNGQSGCVRQILRGRALYIDVSEILEAGGAVDDQIFLRRLCRAVGYWPAQGMDRMMQALLDLLLPGSGKLSRENEVLVAVQRVLSCMTQALVSWKQQQLDEGAASEGVPPMLVIDGFTSENKDRRDGLFEGLVTWAAYVCEARLARVLFVADSSFAEPAMLAALRDRPERLTVHELNDADLESVPRILTRHFQRRGGSPPDFSADDIQAVGGRFRDLAAVVALVDEGKPPHEAVRRQVEAAEINVKTLLALGQPGAKWTRPQLWRAVRLLAAAGRDGVPYDVFLWSVFRGDDAALRSMKESNLISVTAKGEAHCADGPVARRHKVFAGSPLFSEAFRRLVRHEGLSAIFDLEVAKEDIKRETSTADGYEAELVRLQEVDDVRHDKGRDILDPNEALLQRKEQLLRLMLEQHGKLEKYHNARRKAMATLNHRVEESRDNAQSKFVADASVPQGGFSGLLRWIGLAG